MTVIECVLARILLPHTRVTTIKGEVGKILGGHVEGPETVQSDGMGRRKATDSGRGAKYIFLSCRCHGAIQPWPRLICQGRFHQASSNFDNRNVLLWGGPMGTAPASVDRLSRLTASFLLGICGSTSITWQSPGARSRKLSQKQVSKLLKAFRTNSQREQRAC